MYLSFFVSAYKEILDKAGVKNKLVLLKGVLHGFFSLPGKNSIRKKNSFINDIFIDIGIYPKACAQAADAIQEFMASI